MKYAVHNYHTPAILIDPDDKRTAMLTEPLYTDDTFEGAEQWRKANAPKHYEARNTETIGLDRNR